MSVTSDFNLGVISITQSYNISASQSDPDATPYFNDIDFEYIESYINLEKVKKFTKFS